MSFITNPRIIHIVCEIIILCTLIFWISSGKRKLSIQIEKLLLRLEEQEEKIQKMEMFIEQLIEKNQILTNSISSLNKVIKKNRIQSQGESPKPQDLPKPQEVFSPKIEDYLSKSQDLPKPQDLPKYQDSPTSNKLPQNIFVPTPISKMEFREEETESDLDDELKEELAELMNNNENPENPESIEIDTDDLKKKDTE